MCIRDSPHRGHPVRVHAHLLRRITGSKPATGRGHRPGRWRFLGADLTAPAPTLAEQAARAGDIESARCCFSEPDALPRGRCPDDNGAVFARALVAFDGSAGSRRALELGLQLAAEHGTAVTVLTVEAHLPHYAATVGEMDEERRREEQQAHRVLTEASAVAAEVILLGHSGHSAIWGRFLGSTAEKVSRHAACSVLIVR